MALAARLPWGIEAPDLTDTSVDLGVEVNRRSWRRACDLTLPVTDAAALVLAATVAGAIGRTALLYGLTVLTVAWLQGSYRSRLAPGLTGEVRELLTALAIPLFGAFLVPASQLPALTRLLPAAAVATLLGRAAGFAAIRTVRRRALLIEPVIVVGAGSLGVRFVEQLRVRPDHGLLPVGFLDTVDDDGLPAPLLGRPSDVVAIASEFQVRRVIVAFGAKREHEVVDAVRACMRAGIDVYAVPRFFELSTPDTDDVWGTPLVHLRPGLVRTAALRTKRVFDVLVASIGLVLAAPLLPVIAFAVRRSSPGPVLFRQRRIGQDGRPIEVLKFRSMRLNDDSDTTWSVANDSRLTPVGRVLRSTNLDELPQLWNVLRGDMSLVGPRPERPYFVHEYAANVDGYADRHRAPGGVTGWAQVHGLRGDTPIADRARFDNQYIDNWSLGLDLAIVARTAATTLACLVPWHTRRGESGADVDV
jgi:exopolysaccharide biosynthesis polyprenyl glycosylphosphotransferase